MNCPVKTSSGNICNNKAKLYGVCGRHMRYAFALFPTDKVSTETRMNYDQFVAEYIAVINRVKLFSERVDQMGGNLLDTQRLWGYNLCSKPDLTMPATYEEREFARALEDSVKVMQKYQAKSEDKWFPYLISNLACGLREDIMNPNCLPGNSVKRSLLGYELDV